MESKQSTNKKGISYLLSASSVVAIMRNSMLPSYYYERTNLVLKKGCCIGELSIHTCSNLHLTQVNAGHMGIKFQWQVIQTGIWGIFLESFSTDNFRNNYFIFKPNYFISFWIFFLINFLNVFFSLFLITTFIF
jgi:hypothetical protein